MHQIDWSVIHENSGFSFYTLPLAMMSLLYGILVKTRMSFLQNRGKSLPGFVVSVGNITAGGTGKTPVVMMLARWAKLQGYNVAVLSRGYRGKYTDKSAVVSDGSAILLSPEMSGDEPWLMANSLKNVPVLVSKDRHLAGMTANSRFGSNFFLLDDGFQHILLKRNMDIVLADTKTPFGNGHLLPWGPLREPLSGLNRADAFIFTRSGEASPGNNAGSFHNKPMFRGNHVPDRVIFPSAGKVHNLSFINGKRVIAFSGIARPSSFKESLLNLGADIVLFMAFNDHYPFSQRDIIKIQKEKRRLNCDFLITTEKDWVRIKDKTAEMSTLAYMIINFVFTSGEDKFYNMIKTRANAVLS